MRKRPVKTVAIPRNLVQQFRRRAKKAWPKEAYGMLLGRVAGRDIIVEDIHYPTNIERVHTRTSVELTKGMWKEGEIAAAWQGVKVVGDIHSHPYTDDSPVKDCAPSQRDLDRFDNNYVQGIVAVTKCKGRLFTHCRFWIAGPHITTVIMQ